MAGSDNAGLRILSVSPSVVGGGAEKVALDLHRHYVESGVDSWLAVCHENADAPNVVRIPVNEGRGAWAEALLAGGRSSVASRREPPSRLKRVLAEPLRYGRVGLGYEDFDFPWTRGLTGLIAPPPSLLQLHNIHGGYFDIRALPQITATTPTVWTLHDAWALTGHCAYPMTCDHWLEGCGSCPDLNRYVPLRADRSAANWRTKQQALVGSRLTFVTPSDWLAKMVEAAGVLGEGSDLVVIPNAVDTQVFRPGDREAARAELGLAPDKFVLLFAARGLVDSAYKGYGTLARALELLVTDLDPHNLLLVGLGAEPGAAPIRGVEMRSVPFVDEPATVATYLRAADVYVHPARAESFGLAILEAMACGTPVVASDVGGIPEVLADGAAGSLVAPDDPTALAAALAKLIGDADMRAHFSVVGAQRAAEQYPQELQRDRYLALYAELLADGRLAPPVST